MKRKSQNGGGILIKLGRTLFPELPDDAFAELLLWTAWYGFEDGKLDLSRSCNLAEELPIPAQFSEIHGLALQCWEILEYSNDGGGDTDETYALAVYNTELECGLMMIFNSSCGVVYTKPFAFKDGKIPQQKIVDQLWKAWRSDAIPLCGALTNKVPELLSRKCIEKFYQSVDEGDADDFKELFTECYHEDRKKVQKGKK